MRDDRLVRPGRAALFGIVTECNDEIKLRVRELFPRFASSVRRVGFEILTELPARAGAAWASGSIPRCSFQIEWVRFLSRGIQQKYSAQSCQCTERGS